MRALCLLLFVVPAWALPDAEAPFAPPFTQEQPAAWLNSPPLTLEALRGDVVLIEFWTFSCVNCRRSIPWVKSLEERYRERPFRVVGIHTPEFAHERDRAQVAAAVRRLGVRHPVMLDNDYAYWNAMGNRYWPAYYLVDKHGHVRYAYAGEMRVGSERAREVERRLEQLMAEAP